MTTDEIKARVVDYAYGCGINPNLALAQINRESGFNPNAVGSSGERGLAQFMPGTWARFGYGSFDNAFDVEYNLSAWCAYMAYLSGLFGGDESKMLTAYNGGEGHLLDPARYGAPSSAALGYASSILAAAGDWPSDSNGVVADGSGNPPPPKTDGMTIALIIGVSVFALLVFGER